MTAELLQDESLQPPAETVVSLPDDVRASLVAAQLPVVATAPAERPDVLASSSLAPTTPGAISRVDLGDGDWADVLDPGLIRNKHRKQVMRRVAEGFGDTYVSILEEVYCLAILGWSLTLPLPSVDRSSTDELTLEQDDALQVDPAMVAIMKLVAPSMMGQKAAADPSEPSSDPASPTAPSRV